VTKISDQAERFTHTSWTVTQFESYLELAEWLNAHTPGDFEKRTALFSTGTEAVENAVKIARAYTGRPNTLVFDDAFHGRSLMTLAMTAKTDPYSTGFAPIPSETVFRAPFADALQYPADSGEVLSQVEAVLEKVGAETFAAIVIEPIQGEGGFRLAAPGFLAGLREIADRHGIVLVMDEIQAGFGRTGKLYASEWDGVSGDLVTSAKGLAGGMPLSALTGRAEIMDAPIVGALGGTYAGNPVAVAAALGVIEAFEKDGLLDEASRFERTILEVLKPLKEETGIVADVRGRGAMMAVEFSDGDGTPLPEKTKSIAARAHAKGVLLLVCGSHYNVIRLLPALTMPQDVLEDGIGVLRDVIREVAAE
jgi:4-aminobutyrate aminotransferase/(S)-3-amino-2-methylpropionate transaminase